MSLDHRVGAPWPDRGDIAPFGDADAPNSGVEASRWPECVAAAVTPHRGGATELAARRGQLKLCQRTGHRAELISGSVAEQGGMTVSAEPYLTRVAFTAAPAGHPFWVPPQ